jgi:hypothetical protein
VVGIDGMGFLVVGAMFTCGVGVFDAAEKMTNAVKGVVAP